MNRKSFSALLVLNVTLLVALFVIGFSPESAPAQGLGGGPEFLMVAGKSTGRNNVSSVYLIELQTAQMLALQFDTRNDSLDIIGARNLRPDFAAR